MMNGEERSARGFFVRPRKMPCRDRRPLALLEDCYRAELTSFAVCTYRALLCERLSAELLSVLDRIAGDEWEHLRLTGSLILSLGGDPCPSVRVGSARYCVDDDAQSAERVLQRMLGDAAAEKRAAIDRYQTVMARTEDRILRSFVQQIVADEQRHLSVLLSMV